MEKIYKAWTILSSSERKLLLFLILFKIIGMILEVFGIVLIIPLISILLKQQTEFLNFDISELFNFNTQTDYITIMVIIIIFAYFIKNIFLLFLTWADSKFVFGVSARLSKDLFEGYIKLPYFFYLKRNTSKLIYNATSSVDLYKYALTHLVLLASEVFVLIGISAFLFFVEPVGFLCAALLIGLVSVLYYLLNKKRNTEWGEKAQVHQKLKIKNLMQGFGAIKDIIILGIQNFFVKSYQVHNLQSSEMLRKHHLVSQFPKYIFEIMGIIGIMSLLLVLNYKMDNVEKIIIILGVFAAAAFRLMPSANRIINSLQAFRFGIATVDNLSNELKMLNEEIALKSKELNGESYQNNLQKFKKFNLENISYKYPNTEKKILKNISLKLNKGEIVGLFGKTGSGKSTLVDIITGLLNLDNGNITIDEKKFQKVPTFWQRNIGYVPQNIYLLDDTLKNNIALGINEKNVDDLKIKNAVDLSELKTLITTLPAGLDTEVGERGTRLSGGEKQRVGIARALYHDPQILIFDEATNALDTKTEELIMSSIKKLQKDKIILVISHKKITLDFCDRVVELKNGILDERGIN